MSSGKIVKWLTNRLLNYSTTRPIAERSGAKFDFRYEYQNGCKETEIAVECSVLDIRFSFDVGRSMLDVRCSSFKTIPHGINVTCECLQNNLALMGVKSAAYLTWVNPVKEKNVIMQ